MTDLIEKVAWAICFNSHYADHGEDEPEVLTCECCDTPEDCPDWNIYSFGNQRMAEAAIATVLREMMEPTEEMLKQGIVAEMSAPDGATFDDVHRRATRATIRAFATQYNIQIGGDDGLD